jgi:hypothetical protein
MKTQIRFIKITEETEGYIHINSPVNTYHTLCGWCDTDHVEVKGKPNCPSCLEVVSHCKEFLKEVGNG